MAQLCFALLLSDLNLFYFFGLPLYELLNLSLLSLPKLLLLQVALILLLVDQLVGSLVLIGAGFLQPCHVMLHVLSFLFDPVLGNLVAFRHVIIVIPLFQDFFLSPLLLSLHLLQLKLILFVADDLVYLPVDALVPQPHLALPPLL